MAQILPNDNIVISSYCEIGTECTLWFLKKKRSSAPCVTSINHATGTQIVKWLKKKAV